MERALKTTRPVMDVRTIEDIVAIESRPYDELVTAHNLYDLFLATARHGGDRKALTVLRSPDPADVGISLTHRQLLAEITRAANMFRALGVSRRERRRRLPVADAAGDFRRCCSARRWPASRVR